MLQIELYSLHSQRGPFSQSSEPNRGLIPRYMVAGFGFFFGNLIRQFIYRLQAIGGLVRVRLSNLKLPLTFLRRYLAFPKGQLTLWRRLGPNFPNYLGFTNYSHHYSGLPIFFKKNFQAHLAFRLFPWFLFGGIGPLLGLQTIMVLGGNSPFFRLLISFALNF